VVIALKLADLGQSKHFHAELVGWLMFLYQPSCPTRHRL
jgi:hypothetical protein